MRRLEQPLLSLGFCTILAAACGDGSTNRPVKPASTLRDAGTEERGDAGQLSPDSGADAATEPQLKSAHSNLPRDTQPAVDAGALSTLAEGNRKFALELYAKLRNQEGNLFLSPYSISSALAMTAVGARGNTATQMTNTLHFDATLEATQAAFDAADLALASRGAKAAGKDGTPFKLSVVNAVWAQEGFSFESSYLDALAKNFGAGVYLLDFERSPEPSRTTINDWVAAMTAQRIQNLLAQGSVTSDTRLVLTNAAYFNAAWAHQFQKAATQDAAFHAQSGDVTVPMMHSSMETSYGEGAGYQAALLPYSAPELAMLVIVPDAGTFGTFEAGFSADELEQIVSSVKGGYEVDVTLPRFEFRSSLYLGDTLRALGMSDAFTSAADFSGIDGKQDLSISSIVHHAFISVDESGTEAAAATAVTAGVSSAPVLTPATLRADRPFLFAIYDQPTGELLFLGRVLNPKR